MLQSGGTSRYPYVKSQTLLSMHDGRTNDNYEQSCVWNRYPHIHYVTASRLFLIRSEAWSWKTLHEIRSHPQKKHWSLLQQHDTCIYMSAFYRGLYIGPTWTQCHSDSPLGGLTPLLVDLLCLCINLRGHCPIMTRSNCDLWPSTSD